jgi:hypothetical protein
MEIDPHQLIYVFNAHVHAYAKCSDNQGHVNMNSNNSLKIKETYPINNYSTTPQWNLKNI